MQGIFRFDTRKMKYRQSQATKGLLHNINTLVKAWLDLQGCDLGSPGQSGRLVISDDVHGFTSSSRTRGSLKSRVNFTIWKLSPFTLNNHGF